MKKVYLICPVRNCSESMRTFALQYVSRLEASGAQVHFPPRDVDQRDDGIGLAINGANRQALLSCDEVHVVWDPESTGSHFDLGMAYMLQVFRTCPIVLASPVHPTPHKSYTNILRALAGEEKS